MHAFMRRGLWPEPGQPAAMQSFDKVSASGGNLLKPIWKWARNINMSPTIQEWADKDRFSSDFSCSKGGNDGNGRLSTSLCLISGCDFTYQHVLRSFCVQSALYSAWLMSQNRTGASMIILSPILQILLPAVLRFLLSGSPTLGRQLWYRFVKALR